MMTALIPDGEAIQQIRHFNRTVTHRIGVLADDYLGSGRPLGEARLLFEIGQRGSATVRELRACQGLDSGYFSRLLRSLEAQQLINSTRDVADGRVRRLSLTAKGQSIWQLLDDRSKAMAESLISPLAPSQRQRLLVAMAEVERLLRASAVTIGPVDPRSAEAQACIHAYFAELQQRFTDTGFDPALSVSANPEELSLPHGVMLLAWLDGEAIACGAVKFVRPAAPGDVPFAEIKRMWVSPAARGLGISRRILNNLETQAVAAGFSIFRLDSNQRLTEARQLYLRHGYIDIPPYNDNPYAHHWYEKRLAPQALREAMAASG